MDAALDSDRRHLARAIEIAGNGRGQVSPNPLVGAVIARHGELISEGFHRRAGDPHAEVEAIRAAGEADLTDATLYVSLEPCCHHGRTPPCTDAIRDAGIRRVVVASDDPSEHAHGRGLGILRDDGVEVVLGAPDLAQRARLLNQPFRKHARTGKPWILFKSAMSLDGKVATHSGDSRWISGEESRQLVHEWRSALDAVAVGIGTAMTDDPLLTARGTGASSIRQPRRVVFDSLARLPLGSRLVADVPEVPLTVVVSRAAPRAATDGLTTHGVDVIVATGENEQARVGSALEQLGSEGVTSILLEGGPRLAGSFLDAGEIDEIRLFVAPIVLGGRNARDPLESEGVDVIADAVHGLTLTCDRVGEDLLITSRIKEW
jgi:diaminohydroxyphosphoribosylaminopyrimidine deaminase / 5-amino-6-(5-phosphoribosylamino)uracil reductase